MEYEENKIYEFKATITYQKYYNQESCWGAYVASTEDDIPKPPIKGSKTNFINISGKMQHLDVNCDYMVKAKMVFDKKYGGQYVPEEIYSLVPISKEKQLFFLKTLINENVAGNLVDEYPNIVNDVINGDVTDIDFGKVKGMGKTTWEKTKNKIIDNFVLSDILIMLKPLGVTITMIKKLLSEVKNPMLLKKELEENPYSLIKINGLGFKRIDELVLKLKPEFVNSLERLIAFTKFYFKDIGDTDGHTWVDINVFKSAVSNIVPECIDRVDWLLENNEFLHYDNEKIGLRYYFDIEIEIFTLLCKRIVANKNFEFSEEQIEVAIKEAEKGQGFEYVESQRKVIYNVLNNNVSLIAGCAGTGKSSIMKAILIAYNNSKYDISSSALSAMASLRIVEATGFPAETIHRTLKCVGPNTFLYDENCPVPSYLMFMDEGSMVNADLFLTWLKAIPPKSNIIISGDYKQLPPIGYGNIFSDLCELFSKDFKKNVNELTEPMRQAKMSGILVDANLIRDNINPVFRKEISQPRIIHGELKDMFYLFRDNRQTLFDIAIKTFFKSIETDGIDDVIIVTPRKQGCLNSASEINKVIHDRLLKDEKRFITNINPDDDKDEQKNVVKFKLGAKVVQTENNYEKGVFNGDIGYITKIKEKNGHGVSCTISFGKQNRRNREVEYSKTEITQLNLAYALTVHKIQGQGIKTVIGIIDNTHFKLLDACMLYTLVTRAKKRCCLLAEPTAFLQCIRTSHNKRNTWLNVLSLPSKE